MKPKSYRTKTGKARCKTCQGAGEICNSCGKAPKYCVSCTLTSQVIPCPDCSKKDENEEEVFSNEK